MGRTKITFSAIGGTAAGIGHTASARTVIADRPPGKAGGMGLGMNGGELLAAALGGCFWNDLHYVAESLDAALRVTAVDAEIELDGTPARVVSARLTARTCGSATVDLQRRVFDGACAASTIANSLMPAFPITFDHQPSGDPE